MKGKYCITKLTMTKINKALVFLLTAEGRALQLTINVTVNAIRVAKVVPCQNANGLIRSIPHTIKKKQTQGLRSPCMWDMKKYEQHAVDNSASKPPLEPPADGAELHTNLRLTKPRKHGAQNLC